jgi:hypothetical protein
MITVKYDRLTNQTTVELARFSIFEKADLPLVAEFRKTIDGSLGWSHELDEGIWVSWNGGETQYDVVLKTAKGFTAMHWKFDVELNGDQIEKTLYYFIKNLEHRPKGLVIGSHDGLFGHWVFPVIKDMSDVVIVDGSLPQFEKVKTNYSHLTNVKFINEIVTTDGSDVDWMQGGEGFTDTIYKPVILDFIKDEEITHTARHSIAINDLIKDSGENLDWLHLDVEGIDGDLIMAMKYEPTVIIFETMHIDQNKYAGVLDWFQDRNYKLFNDGSNAMAIKIQ